MAGSDAHGMGGGGLDGLVRNRNDPRYAMAQRLLENQAVPEQIYGKGATIMASLGGVAKAISGGMLLSRADADAKAQQDAAAAQQAQQAQQAQDFMRSLGDGGNMGASPAAPEAGPAVMDAPAPQQAPAASQGGLINAVHQLESGGRMVPGIRGDGGQAAGPMQVHPAALADVNKARGTAYTHEQLAADPAIGKQVGDAYLGMQREAFGRDDYAMGAFNAGPGAMRRAISTGQGVAGLPASAQDYVRRGMGMLGDGAAKAALLPAGPDATPRQQALATRLDPSIVERRQQAALMAAGSGNPMLERLAPLLNMQAQQQAGQLDRQDGRAQAETLRRDAMTAQQQARQDALAFRQDQARQAEAARADGRIPVGFRMKPDGTGAERIPGVPEPAPMNMGAPAPVQTAEGVFARNADGTLGPRLGGLPAERTRDEKPPPAAAVKAVTTNMSSLRTLDAAIAEVERNPDAFGAKNYLPGALTQRLDPGGVAARAATADVGSLQLHERIGSAQTAGEFARTAPFVPLGTDTAETVLKKMRRMRGIAADLLSDQYSVYGDAVPGLGRSLGLDAAPAADAPAPMPPQAAAARGRDVPFPVKTDADYEGLASGSLFAGPDGKTRRKP